MRGVLCRSCVRFRSTRSGFAKIVNSILSVSDTTEAVSIPLKEQSFYVLGGGDRTLAISITATVLPAYGKT